MRASVLLESDPAAAVRAANDILLTHPGQAEASLLLATACRRLGDPAAAREQLAALVRSRPDSPLLQLELGRAAAATGQSAEAVAALESAVRLDARLAEGWRELAAQRFLAGDTTGGDAAYAEYTRLAGHPPELSDAAEALVHRRFEAARALLERHLQRSPDDVVALRMLAGLASMSDDFFEAERLLQRCLRIAPGYAEARFDLASELYTQQRHREALPLLDRLLATDPANVSYLGLKAQTLRLFGRNEEALALMRQAIAASPGNAKLQLLYGHLLREVGEQRQAIDAYRAGLALQPGMGEAYWSLANLKTVHFDEEDRRNMLRELSAAPPLGSNRAMLEFALGKALEDAGEYEQSFAHYTYGNNLHRAMVFHDATVLDELLRRSRALYQSAFFAARNGWGRPEPDPIFVVGMPRSGSTLIEQILASHSQVEGTRELPEIPHIVRELLLAGPGGAELAYPDIVARLEREQLSECASRYLQRTAGHRSLGRPRFVDKLLGNFAHIGLIHLMFPRATIIDARRHPLACCFSCYKQFFARSLYFTYDQEELGRYYRDYSEFMEHWDSVLPGRVYRVHYEELVAHPERVVRGLLEHCGLPFEEGCLRFHENRRVVGTVSSEQVRRPISTDAVEHWRHYAPWLGELKKILGDLIDRYPSFAEPGSPGP